MLIRDHILEYQDDIGTSGTVTYNLDYTEPISELMLLFEGTNGGTSNLAAPLERCVSKIEVVDGGEVLFDLPGDVLLGLVAGEKGALEHAYRSEAASAAPKQAITIPFGRYLYDTLFAFNPVAHRNPQLKVTFDEATVRAAGATGYVSDSFTLTILAKLMQDVPSPQGFLSCRDVYQFTSLGSGDERVELPTDRLLRQLIVRIYESGIAPSTDITNLKLSADGGRFIPFDLYTDLFIAKMTEQYPQVFTTGSLYAADDTASEVWLETQQGAQIVAAGNDVIGSLTSFGDGQVTPDMFDTAGADVANGVIKYSTFGYGFQATYMYPFGMLDNPEHWFNATQYRQLDLYLTQGGADAEVNIGVQQVYPY